MSRMGSGRGESALEELKLFLVTFGGADPCFKLQVAKNAEEAFLQCFDRHRSRDGHEKASCKVIEVSVEGYDIVIKPTTSK